MKCPPWLDAGGHRPTHRVDVSDGTAGIMQPAITEGLDISSIQNNSGRLKDFSPERGHSSRHPRARHSASCRGKARGTWPVTRRSTMETLILAFAFTLIAILVLTDATVAATAR